MPVEIIDVGNRVQCDVCCKDYTGSLESGGFLFGSYAYCPTCAVEHMPKIIGYNEQHLIKATCPQGMPFWKWVLKLRDGDNTIRIYT